MRRWKSYPVNVNDMFSSWSDTGFGSTFSVTTETIPAQNPTFFRWTMTDNVLTLIADVPGVRAEELTLTFEGNDITVKVPLRDTKQSFKEHALRLDSSWDLASATATLELGVLVVTVPAKQKPAKQVISIPIVAK